MDCFQWLTLILKLKFLWSRLLLSFGDISKSGKATKLKLESSQEDNLIYKHPKVSTWEVFSRPGNISKMCLKQQKTELLKKTALDNYLLINVDPQIILESEKRFHFLLRNSVLHLNGKISSWEAVDSAIGSFVAEAIVTPTKSVSGCSVEVRLAISPQVLALNSSPKSLPLLKLLHTASV